MFTPVVRAIEILEGVTRPLAHTRENEENDDAYLFLFLHIYEYSLYLGYVSLMNIQ